MRFAVLSMLTSSGFVAATVPAASALAQTPSAEMPAGPEADLSEATPLLRRHHLDRQADFVRLPVDDEAALGEMLSNCRQLSLGIQTLPITDAVPLSVIELWSGERFFGRVSMSRRGDGIHVDGPVQAVIPTDAIRSVMPPAGRRLIPLRGRYEADSSDRPREPSMRSQQRFDHVSLSLPSADGNEAGHDNEGEEEFDRLHSLAMSLQWPAAGRDEPTNRGRVKSGEIQESAAAPTLNRSGIVPAPTMLSLEFQSGDDRTRFIRLMLEHDPHRSDGRQTLQTDCGFPCRRQRLVVRPGERGLLRVDLSSGILVSVDGMLSVSVPSDIASTWRLRRIMVDAPQVALRDSSTLDAADSAQAIPNSVESADAFVIGPAWAVVESNLRSATVAARRSPDSRQDCVIHVDGDETYGSIEQVGSTVVLNCADRRLSWPAEDVPGIRFARPAALDARACEPGWLADITLQPHAWVASTGSDSSAAFRLRCAVRRATSAGLQISHPYLGNQVLRWELLQVIRPLQPAVAAGQPCAGLWLHTGPRHLGSRLRPDFTIAEPDGVEWEIEFSGRDLHAGAPSPADKSPADDTQSDGQGPDGVVSHEFKTIAWLCVDVSDVIPGGPETRASSPMLAALRDGHLVTEVLLNGRSLGTLNEHLTAEPPASSPAVVAIPVPFELIHPDVNRLVFRQHPDGDDPSRFDDCEIHATALFFTRRP